jgi:hypothetical protein
MSVQRTICMQVLLLIRAHIKCVSQRVVSPESYANLE